MTLSSSVNSPTLQPRTAGRVAKRPFCAQPTLREFEIAADTKAVGRTGLTASACGNSETASGSFILPARVGSDAWREHAQWRARVPASYPARLERLATKQANTKEIRNALQLLEGDVLMHVRR
jgi:hypothetical protein